MKTLSIVACIPLALISLMNVGFPFGTDPKPDVTLAIAIVLLGLAGLVAVWGLARGTAWGIPAAVAVAGVNVVVAIIALAADAEGAVVGLAVSGVALALAAVAGSGARRASVA